MRREWSQFWFAVGLIAITAALIANISHDDEINLGPLSAWLAALATLGAVTVALFNTDRTIKDAVRRELESERKSGDRFRLLVNTLAFRLKTSLRIYWKEKEPSEWSLEDIEYLENRLRLEEIIGILSRAPLHQAPDQSVISDIELLLFEANNCVHDIKSGKDEISATKLEHISLDFDEPLNTCEEIFERTKKD